MRTILSRLSRRHTTAVAYLALFVALGGSAYAIRTAKAPKNSVVTRSIKLGAVTRAKIADDAVNGAKVAPGALSATDIDVASLGIPKAQKFVVRSEVKEAVTLPENSAQEINVKGRPEELVVGGGARASASQLALSESSPTIEPKLQGWRALLVNHSTSVSPSSQIQVFAICAWLRSSHPLRCAACPG